ncbi:MAG TPA: polyprenyl synthetase family protein [Balneolaceae bacterium]|nr:polyprenyl synthetase family protein [Balneolaceae bacterium]
MNVDDTTQSLNKDVQKHIDRINELITNGDFQDSPDTLYEPIRYILNTGGKRLRPLLTLFGCYLFSGETENALMPGIGIELFHNFTLIHDDIMDNAPLRRGQETVHRKWNQNVAILSGDTILFKAYHYLMQVNEPLIKDVIMLFNECAIDVCEGQQFDMDFENRERVSEEEYLKMIRLKTAAVLGFSLQLGALIGGANVENTEALKNFGINIGLGFQLKDDLLDVFGDFGKFGKQVGGDIIANKKTYLLIKAMELANAEQNKKLQGWLHGDLSNEEKVKRVTQLYKELHIRQLTEQKISEFFEIALTYLNKIDCPEHRKEELADFSSSLIEREN